MSRSIDTDSRLAAADPAREVAIDDRARAELWRRLLAEQAQRSEPAPVRRRRRIVRRPMLLIAPLVLVLAAGALAAGGVIEFGSPAKLPFSLLGNAREGSGSLAPGTVRLLPIHAPDPAGGPDWGMRVLSTTRGEGCIQIGRLLDGKLGAIGQDGAFGNDARFHVLPVSAAFNSIGCTLLDGSGRLFTNVTADERPASGWIGDGGRLGGCVPASAGPYEKGLRLTRRERAEGARPAAICRQSDLRNIYYGLLGPQATSITYKLDGRAPHACDDRLRRCLHVRHASIAAPAAQLRQCRHLRRRAGRRPDRGNSLPRRRDLSPDIEELDRRCRCLHAVAVRARRIRFGRQCAEGF